ncbi:MAG: OmpA/MotB family protein [Magnetovibrionaceae bacterium]
MAAPQNQEDEEDESWMTTYADAITLLMAFFVMLVSFSKIDIPSYEEVAAGIRNEIGKKETESPITILDREIKDAIYELQADQVVQVSQDDEGVVIELASGAFYEPGSATLRTVAEPVLLALMEKFNSSAFQNYMVDIEGHTDDDPISTARFPSNWELSGGRSSAVARLYIANGLDQFRLRSTGYAETRPKVPNRTAEGVAIKENQAQNRRVVIRVYPMSLEELAERNRLRDLAAYQEKVQEQSDESAPPAVDTQPNLSSDPSLEGVPQFQGTDN